MGNFLLCTKLFDFNCNLIGHFGAQLASDLFTDNLCRQKTFAAVSNLVLRKNIVGLRYIGFNFSLQLIQVGLAQRRQRYQSSSINLAGKKLQMGQECRLVLHHIYLINRHNNRSGIIAKILGHILVSLAPLKAIHYKYHHIHIRDYAGG